MLKYLDEDIYYDALDILKIKREKVEAVKLIATLVAGKSLLEVREASRKAAYEIQVPKYLHSILEGLKPTRLVLWSDTPRETIEAFKDIKIYPLYNRGGKPMPIDVYATDLEHTNGLLTGNINFLPDQMFRQSMQNFESIRYNRLRRRSKI